MLFFRPPSTQSTPSLSEVWNEYGQKIEHLCLSMLGREHAADARQEVALALPQALERFQGKSKLSSYIYAIARTICLRHLQRNYRTRQKFEDLEPDLLHSSDEDLEIRSLKREIGQLEPKLRTPLLLVLIEGYTVAEASEMLNEAEGTLKTRIRAAKEKLARRMNQGDKQ